MARRSREALPPTPVSESYDAARLTPRAMTRQEFGRRLNALMLDRDWNQSDLARAAHVGRDSVSKYVNGLAFPTPLAVKKLAAALGVTREELLPNTLMKALDDEHPAVELRQAAGHPDKAWLRVNRAVPFDIAAKIVALINDADRAEKG